MANIFLTPDIIAREALVLLQSNLVATRLFSRRYEADLNPGSKVGDTIRIRRRAKGVVDTYTGSAITIRDIQESSINLVLEKHFDASIRITDKERTLKVKDFSEQVLAPRIVEMGEQIDLYALGKLADLPNVAGVGQNVVSPIGVPGALPNSIATFALVEKTLNDLKIPLNPRYQVVSPKYKATLLGVTSFTEVDHAGETEALRLARLNSLMGIQTFMGQNVPSSTFTGGTQTSGVVNGTTFVKGTTVIQYDGGGVAAGTLLIGDIVNIAGYGNVVVAANNTAAAGVGTLTIKEPLREDVADNATFTVYDGGGGANKRTIQGAVFHPDAFAFVSAPLDQPVAAESAYMQDPATGLSLRATYDYDRDLKADVLSIDILVGAAMIDGRMGGQIIEDAV